MKDYINSIQYLLISIKVKLFGFTLPELCDDYFIYHSALFLMKQVNDKANSSASWISQPRFSNFSLEKI